MCTRLMYLDTVYSLIIYYFTGTGNGKRVAELAADAWRARGADVIVQSIEGSLKQAEHKKADFIGVVAPVYGFGLPQMMVRFLRTLPAGTGQRAFVFIATGNAESFTWAGRVRHVPPSEGIALLQARFWLRRRGYLVYGALPVEMPTNWTLAVTPPSHVRQTVIFERAQASIDRAVRALFDKHLVLARTPWRWVPFFALTYVLFIHLGRRLAGKFFTASHRCNHCGFCRDHCPSGAIGWRYNRPYWGWNCQQCFRCVNYCPRGAIDVPWITILGGLAALIAGYMPYDWLPPALTATLGTWNIAASTGMYLLVFALVVWLLHELHANPLTRVLLPNWYAMARRTRYREPHFIPEPRRLIEPRRPLLVVPETPEPEKPAPRHTLLIKPPEDAGDEQSTETAGGK